MGWNKNTVVESEVDAVVSTLKDVGQSYDLIVVGNVIGRGVNDGLYGPATYYPIRRLIYVNMAGETVIIREQMERDPDCDVDDALISMRVKTLEEASIEQMPLEMQLPDLSEIPVWDGEIPE